MKFRKWVPVDNIPQRMHLEGLHDDYEGFRLLLRGESLSSRMLRIAYDNPLLYRNTDEGDRLRMLSNSSILGEWPLFKVSSSDSELVKWLHEESRKIRSPDRMHHYVIATPNDIVEVVSECSPEVVWI